MSSKRFWAYAGLFFFWGTTFLSIRIALRSLPPFFLSGLRHSAAGLCFLLYARARGAAWPSRKEVLGAVGLGIAFLAVSNGLCAWSIQYMDSGYGTLLNAGVPLMAMVYGALVHRQKVRAAEWGLLLMGFLGVGLLLSPQASAVHSSRPLALAVITFATFVWAVTMVEKKNVPFPADPILSTALQMLGGGLTLLLVSGPLEHAWSLDFGAVPAKIWLAWAYLVFFGSLIGYGSFSWLLTIDPPELVGTYAYVTPIVAVLAGHFVLGEKIGASILVSGALVIVSVAGLLRLERDDAQGRA
jgi:drug/metabolite transporter (DMT)-like permease